MKIRAFVIDDEEELRNIISIFLKERGYEVYEFPDPSTCPILLEKECPCPPEYACTDFIITDINMPNITGIEFIKNQKKKRCKVKNIAIISGGWSPENEEQAKNFDCKIFKKPFNVEEFINWLKDCESRIAPNRKLSDWFNNKVSNTTPTP